MIINVKMFTDALETKLAHAMTMRHHGRPKYWEGYIDALEDELAYARICDTNIANWIDAGDVEYHNPVMQEGYNDAKEFIIATVKESV